MTITQEYVKELQGRSGRSQLRGVAVGPFSVEVECFYWFGKGCNHSGLDLAGELIFKIKDRQVLLLLMYLRLVLFNYYRWILILRTVRRLRLETDQGLLRREETTRHHETVEGVTTGMTDQIQEVQEVEGMTEEAGSVETAVETPAEWTEERLRKALTGTTITLSSSVTFLLKVRPEMWKRCLDWPGGSSMLE